MEDNYILPLRVSIGNDGDREKAFVPYRENFVVTLQPQDVIVFGINSSNEGIYYRGQETEGLVVGVADNTVNVETGTYNTETGFETNATYGVVQDEFVGKVIGTVPYVENPGFGLESGNVFTIRLKNREVKNNRAITEENPHGLPSGKICKITNIKVDGGYNEYTRSEFEEDGSLIVLVNVRAGSTLEVMVKWTEDADFVTYTYTFDEATMQEA